MATTLGFPIQYLSTEDRDDGGGAVQTPPDPPPIIDALDGSLKRGEPERVRGAARLQYGAPAALQ